ncbi:MAG: hypothetical protein Q4D42_10745 [Eubacteriales bacterium]|nr:hypothetical protein [Eubacteriales bacterium]
MFDSMKQLFSAKETLNSTKEQIEEAEARLQELQDKLNEAESEIAAQEATISKQDDIIVAIHQQTTAERQAIVDKFAVQEAQTAEKLAQTEEKLKKAKAYFEDCERQVYCMANLYKAMRAAITRYSASSVPEDIDMTPEEMEELRLTEESVGLKMHSYKMEDLHKMHEANNKLLEQLLTRYETRLIVPADRVVFQLMTLGIRAELQQIINDMTYGELNRAQVKLHLATNKYLKIVSFAKLGSIDELTAFASELEILLKETLRLEHAYLERRSDYERHKRVFGDPDEAEDTES